MHGSSNDFADIFLFVYRERFLGFYFAIIFCFLVQIVLFYFQLSVTNLHGGLFIPAMISCWIFFFLFLSKGGKVIRYVGMFEGILKLKISS
jgi:hypothetical protein